jgi:hypothetical protein
MFALYKDKGTKILKPSHLVDARCIKENCIRKTKKTYNVRRTWKDLSWYMEVKHRQYKIR